MRSRTPAVCVPALLALLLAAVPASAGTITIPLPDLLGEYVLTPTGGCPEEEPFLSPDSFREMSFGLPFGAAAVQAARVVLVGSATSGLVRGDGLMLEDVEAVAVGAFHLSLALGTVGYDSYWQETAALAGPFGLDVGLTNGVRRGPPEAEVGAVVKSILMIGAYDPGPPPYIPPSGGAGFGDGLITLVPPRATVTEAYLVLEGPGVPEPATLSLLAAGGALVACRRRRSASVP